MRIGRQWPLEHNEAGRWWARQASPAQGGCSAEPRHVIITNSHTSSHDAKGQGNRGDVRKAEEHVHLSQQDESKLEEEKAEWKNII